MDVLYNLQPEILDLCPAHPAIADDSIERRCQLMSP